MINFSLPNRAFYYSKPGTLDENQSLWLYYIDFNDRLTGFASQDSHVLPPRIACDRGWLEKVEKTRRPDLTVPLLDWSTLRSEDLRLGALSAYAHLYSLCIAF